MQNPIMGQESSCSLALGVPWRFALQHPVFVLCWDWLRAQVQRKSPAQLLGEFMQRSEYKSSSVPLLRGCSEIAFPLKLCTCRKHLGWFCLLFFFFFKLLFDCNNVLHFWLFSFCGLIFMALHLGLPRWSSISYCA